MNCPCAAPQCTVLPCRLPFVTNPYRTRVNAIGNLVPPFGPYCQALVTAMELEANNWVPTANPVRSQTCVACQSPT